MWILILVFGLIWSEAVLPPREVDAMIDIALNLRWDVNITDDPCAWSGITCSLNKLFVQTISRGHSPQGTIPDSIGNLTKLENLILPASNIQGSIPESIGYITTLLDLELANNELEGTIPDTIGNCINLGIIYLNNNKLSGTIPETITKLTVLQILFLNVNQLSGTIPNVENMTALSRLLLNDNNLNGTIPNVQSLINLILLSFSGNQLSGTIPQHLGNLTFLVALNIFDNHISGTIPESVGGLISLFRLDLSGNELTGTIPESIGGLISLVRLNLSSNSLTGPIPSSIGNLTSLFYLMLNRNSLTGNIPESLSALTFYVDLSYNQLIGTIPNSFENFKFSWLDITSNRIIGPIPNICPTSNLSLLSYPVNSVPAIVTDFITYWELGSNFETYFGLSCGVMLFDCIPHPYKCILTSTQNTNFTYCKYPCDVFFDNTVQLKDITGFSIIYLNGYEEIVSISNSQVILIGIENKGLSIHTLYVVDSVIRIDGSFSSFNGTIFLKNSSLIVNGIANIVGSSITFGENSIIETNSVQIESSLFTIDFNMNSDLELIHFNDSSASNIDLHSINIYFTNHTSIPSCHQLQTRTNTLLVSISCEPPTSSFNINLIGAIVGGVFGVVLLSGIAVFIWFYLMDKSLLSSSTGSPAKTK